MFKINRKIEYALIALKYMSCKNPGQLTTAKEICDIYQTPFDSTSRVLQIMAQNEVVRAEHGAHGGYQILKDLNKLTMDDLTQMITGPIEIANCIHSKISQCELTSCCSVIGPMLNLNEKISGLFETITVGELIQSKHQDEKSIKDKPISASKVN